MPRPNHLTVVDADGLPSTPDAALIAEFCAQADVVDVTRRKYRTQLEEFSIWLSHPHTVRAGARATLAQVTRADVARFMAYLMGGERYAAPAHACRKGQLAPSTRKSFLASLRSLYRYLISVDLAQVDPTDGITRPKVKLKPGLRLTAEELKALLNAPGTPRDRIQVYLLAYTAARTNEIRTLRWQDVNLVDSTMILHGKGDKYRMIHIHAKLLRELRRWQLTQVQRAESNPALAEALADPDTAHVLLTRTGRQLPHNAMSKQLKRRAARAGLYVLGPEHGEHRSRVSPHALRRTFATLLLNDGHHLDAVADVLGHASVDTTRDHYAFASDARKRATIEAFDV